MVYTIWLFMLNNLFGVYNSEPDSAIINLLCPHAGSAQEYRDSVVLCNTHRIDNAHDDTHNVNDNVWLYRVVHYPMYILAYCALTVVHPCVLCITRCTFLRIRHYPQYLCMCHSCVLCVTQCTYCAHYNVPFSHVMHIVLTITPFSRTMRNAVCILRPF